MERFQINIEGYEICEKRAEYGGNSARVYVPKHWRGKKVKLILLEDSDNHEKIKN